MDQKMVRTGANERDVWLFLRSVLQFRAGVSGATDKRSA